MELSVTIDELMAWKPCVRYPRSWIEALFAGRERITALQILDWDVPAEDRLWGVLREELIPAVILHELGCRFAERELLEDRKAGREPDERIWAAIEAKRAWLRGDISDEDLFAARSNASDAARSNASDAARSNASDAARSNAWSVAYLSASGAAWETQLEMVREMLLAPSGESGEEGEA